MAINIPLLAPVGGFGSRDARVGCVMMALCNADRSYRTVISPRSTNVEQLFLNTGRYMKMCAEDAP